MAEREPVIVDGRVVEGGLEAAFGTALARRGLTGTTVAPATEPARPYSEQTMTPAETTDWLIEQGLAGLARQAVGEFALDRLPEIHEFTAEWVQQQLTDPSQGPWLILVGPTGCGKTSQSFVAARNLIVAFARRGRSLDWRFVTHRNFAAKVQRGSDEDADEVLARYATVKDLLIFSDLGDFNNADFGRAADYTSRLINHRYHHQLPTIYETNLLFDRDEDVIAAERETGTAIQTMDQVLDERVIDRLKAGWIAPLPEINYRRAKGRVMGA